MDIICMCILSRVALVDIDIALCNLRVCTLAAASAGKIRMRAKKMPGRLIEVQSG